jgi:hypothetical protein
MTILRVNVWGPGQISERDHEGNQVDADKSAAFNIRMTNELVLSARPLAFHVIVRVPKAICSNGGSAGALAFEWLVDYLPARCSRNEHWDFFGPMRLDYPKNRQPLSEPTKWPAETPVELSPHLEGISAEAASHLSNVEAAFDLAKRRLEDWAFQNTCYGFTATLGQARDVLRTIQRVLHASADLGGCHAPQAQSALRNYEELARRRIESNANYQYALRSLQRFAMGVRFPRTWNERPYA